MPQRKTAKEKVIVFCLFSIFLYSWTILISSIGIRPDLILAYFTNPLFILLNGLPLVLFFLFFTLLFKRLSIGFFLTFLILSLFSLAHTLKMHYRNEVLTWKDFDSFLPGLQILPNYLNAKILALLLLFLAFLVATGFLSHKFLRDYTFSLPTRLIGLILVILSSTYLFYNPYRDFDLFMKFTADESLGLHKEIEAFQAHGLPYTFLYNLQYFDPRESCKPQEAQAALSPYPPGHIPEDRAVNLILFQLEAFKDFSPFMAEPFLVDPYTNYRTLQSLSLEGRLIVDVYGGGTKDTELKVATANTILNNFNLPRTSVARFFKDQGYHTSFIHPNTGDYYNRKRIYPQLAYDQTLFKEGPAKPLTPDGQLLDMALDLMARSPEKDFCHIVGIANHGPYSQNKEYEVPYVPDEIPAGIEVNNYLAGIGTTSRDLLYRIKDLEDYPEPLVIVFYGDHSPSFFDDHYQALSISDNLDDLETLALRRETPILIYANQKAKDCLDKDFTGYIGLLSPAFLLPNLLAYMDYQLPPDLAYLQDFKEERQISYISHEWVHENGAYRIRNPEDRDRDFDALYNVNLYRSKLHFIDD